MFDWEHGIALQAMQENHASSHGEGEVSWILSNCSRNLGYILEFWRGWSFETRVCSAKSGLLSIYDAHLRNLKWAWQDNTNASLGDVRDQASLSIWDSDIGIPINFQEETGIVTC